MNALFMNKKFIGSCAVRYVLPLIVLAGIFPCCASGKDTMSSNFIVVQGPDIQQYEKNHIIRWKRGEDSRGGAEGKRQRFDLEQFPIFKQYGFVPYRQIKGVNATPNKSGNLFFVRTPKDYLPASLLIFSKDLSTFKALPLPETSEFDAVIYQWMGNKIFVGFLHGYRAVHGSHYYCVDLTSDPINFRTISASSDLTRKDFIGLTYGGVFWSHPDKSLIAATYCLKTEAPNPLTLIWMTDAPPRCVRWGAAISNGTEFQEIFTRKASKNGLAIGWDADNFYIKETRTPLSSRNFEDTLYALPIDSLTWQTPRSVEENQ